MTRSRKSPDWQRRFDDVCARKTAAADAARFAAVRTLADASAARDLSTVGDHWTRAAFDGPFLESRFPDAGVPSTGVVFVQSRDGNTGTRNPGALGAGAVDEHLIYEGLSRVAADAVVVGAGTLYRDSLFSVWRRELVDLRRDLGYPRHPAQVVLSGRGSVDPDAALLFNVPSVAVFVIASRDGAARLARAAERRPWMRVVAGASLEEQFRALRAHGIVRASCVGGRRAATALVSAGLVNDVYVTHAPLDGGEAGTPWYVGPRGLRLEPVLSKEWDEAAGTVRFEHSVIPGSSR
jgi:riboflavin biosynthesis pyrimidine reductase